MKNLKVDEEIHKWLSARGKYGQTMNEIIHMIKKKIEAIEKK